MRVFCKQCWKPLNAASITYILVVQVAQELYQASSVCPCKANHREHPLDNKSVLLESFFGYIFERVFPIEGVFFPLSRRHLRDIVMLTAEFSSGRVALGIFFQLLPC